jgi:hypothetical protein
VSNSEIHHICERTIHKETNWKLLNNIG